MSEEIDSESRMELTRTVILARAALSSPEPPEGAETNSRRQVESLMADAALSPRVLREAFGLPARPPWWHWLWRIKR